MADSREKRFKYELKQLNPNALQLLRFATNPKIRFIILYGGSSSGKSYSVAQILTALTFSENGNILVMRKVGASISKTIFEDFKQAAIQLGVYDRFTFRQSTRSMINNDTGVRIDFSGLDDPEKIKGISNYRWVFMEELSEYALADFKQIRKRLRGKKGQQIIGAFNPIKETHWIKRDWLDGETWRDLPMAWRGLPAELLAVKSLKINSDKQMLNPRTKEVETHTADTILIQSTYLNNFWVVGSPDGTYGFYDEQCIADFERDRVTDPDYYSVYALGEWGVIRTGSEFFASFNQGRHCADCECDPELPLHVSVDNNRLPYIAISLWQCSYEGGGAQLRQVGECPAGNPDNTARKAAVLLAGRLKAMGYRSIILHGDATTRSGNTIDDEGRSFLDLFISTLQGEGVEVDDRIGTKNPSVAMSGEFINAVLDGLVDGHAIAIGKDCHASIEDYLSVQKDENGAILKTRVKDKATGQSYEEHGHLSDTFRYVAVDLMGAAYTKFANRRKRNIYAKDGLISFYPSAPQPAYAEDVVYAMPNVGGKFAMLMGSRVADKWHVRDIAYVETASAEEVKARLLALGCENTIVECGDAYFPLVRQLREADLNVRAMRECSDVDGRIAATSDYVRTCILFSAEKAAEDPQYSAFVESLLDYSSDGRGREASAALSGFAQYCAKSQSEA